MSEWLDSELSRQLAPVVAPDTLWARIHEQRRPLRSPSVPWRNWSLAAAALIILVAGFAWRLRAARNQDSSLETLATQELAALNSTVPARLDIRSADPLRLSSWMQATLNVNLPLSHPVSPGIQLIGARLVDFRGTPVGVVAYRTGKRIAALLVTLQPMNSPRASHRAPSRTTRSDTLYSWTEGRNNYALAMARPDNTREPCLLCHAGPSAELVLP